MLVLVSVKVILWHISSLPWFERVAGHVDESYRADCVVFMPEVQLDEHVCFVTRWITTSATMLTASFFEIIATLLDSFQKKQELVRLNAPSIIGQFKFYESLYVCILSTLTVHLMHHLTASRVKRAWTSLSFTVKGMTSTHVFAVLKIEQVFLLFNSSPIINTDLIGLKPGAFESAQPFLHCLISAKQLICQHIEKWSLKQESRLASVPCSIKDQCCVEI